MTIFNLQILRGLAALGVVFYHTDFRLPGDLHTEFFGVSTFFVISGFIMCFISRDDVEADSFLVRRAIRIVPLYWFCTLTLLIIFRHPPPTYHLDPLLTWWSTNMPYFFQSLFFIPSDTPPMLGVGWTLNFEVYFYVVFAAALFINRRFAPLIACTVVYAVIRASGYVDNFLIKFYSHGYINYFLYGIALYYVWTFIKDHLPKWPVIITSATIIFFAYGSQFFSPLWATYPAALSFGTYMPVLLVAASLFAASSGADIAWKPLVLLGDASYALYLTHTLLMEGIRVAKFHGTIPMPSPKESVGSMLGVMTASVLVGIAVHLCIEKPMLRLIRQYRPARKVELRAISQEKMTPSAG